jgi:hypothetical protein
VPGREIIKQERDGTHKGEIKCGKDVFVEEDDTAAQ